MLHIVLPFAKVLCSVGVLVQPIAIGLVVFPIAFVDVSVSVPELSLAVCSIICPFSFVTASVWPCLSTPALFDATFVDVTVVDSLRRG